MNNYIRKNGARALEKDFADGGLTLVLGSGVSKSWGAPSWEELSSRVILRAGLQKGEQVVGNPPLQLEAAAIKLGNERFTDLLREEIWSGVNSPSSSSMINSKATLAVVARVILADHNHGPSRRFLRVITFNADDLLEQSIAALAKTTGDTTLRECPITKVISRASHHPMHRTGLKAVPIYHLHGYLPRKKGATAWHEDGSDSLVFTDSQYWASGSWPTSYANRVMLNALHDSHCVFIGLSMTDPNILRWLATRYQEIKADKQQQFLARPKVSQSATDRAIQQALRRHYWIRAGTSDGSGLLSEVLLERGVTTIPISSWADDSFEKFVGTVFKIAT